MIDATSRPQRNLGTYTRRSGQTILIETYHDGYEVNDTGARVWSMVGGGSSLTEIADTITAEYEVDLDDARAAVTAFLTELVEREFVTWL